jgi:flagellar biosynthesis component FlhA
MSRQDRGNAAPASHSHTPLHRRRVRNTLLGILFFVLGVIGIFIPVMPQIIFFLLSLVFFFIAFPSLRRRLRRFRRRHPSLDRAYVKWREKSRQRRLKLIRKARKIRHDFEERFDGHAR